VLIADDCVSVCNAVESILRQNFVSIKLVAKTDSVNDTIDALYKYMPDIAILDIHLYGGTAIEIVKRTCDLDYKIIFMSAYQEYALEDIRMASIDFVYKPIDVGELIVTVDQVISNLVEDGYCKKIQTFFNNTISKQEDKNIVLKSSEDITSVKISDIVCGESLFGKSRFYFVARKTIEIASPLRRYESILQSYLFYRCHTKYVINLSQVQRIDISAQHVIMSNGMAIPSDSRRFNGLIKKMQQVAAKDLSIITAYRLGN